MFLNSSATELITANRDVHSSPDSLRVEAVLASLTTSEAVRFALGGELAKGGLTLPGFNVLAFFATCDPRPVRRSEIDRAAMISAANVSTTLARLESSGLLSRRRDVGDRRIVWLSLTPAGRQHVAKVIARCVAGLTAVAAALDEQQLRRLISAHAQIKAGTARLLSTAPDPGVVERVITSRHS